MLIKIIVFLTVFMVILKVGVILALCAAPVAAFQFAYAIDGGRGVKVAGFIVAFGLVLTLAIYFVGFAAFVLGAQAATAV